MKNITATILFIFVCVFVFAQEPVKPYPYHSEEVTFKNDEGGITLAGTLTLPEKEGVFPAVVLISGNGRQNRDEEFPGHKPFLVLSDYLTRSGIAVLRYDKRGVAASTGDYEAATTKDLSEDVSYAVKYLQTRKEIDRNKIGLIGHSEGGIIAPMVAGKEKNISFIVLLAGPGLPGDHVLLSQQMAIAKASGVAESDIQKIRELNEKAFSIVKNNTDPEVLKQRMTNYVSEISKGDPDKPEGMTEKEYVDLQVERILSPWIIYYLRYDPSKALEKVKCPVLALNGAKDLQVLPKENLTAIEEALKRGGNEDIAIKEISGLNHLFQECKTGLPNEYESIKQSFSPIAMDEILTWIKKQI
ncbi:alpha/beta fold hydrolase [Leptobacterium flavescens]|uniref:Alpha/beta fold hydrolase n=1 Tax=Leptobacterium flavescens TaxID=472055 RepID=A0A6P0UIU6_9FLAO|nr:alpha/beta fold hydrolase [Leptobacterium flavescens]NER12462.1 alpha/beta fold hydrolase [Leptobacterium flavescens]